MSVRSRLDKKVAERLPARALPVSSIKARAGARSYLRSRDLPKLLALWPHELEDESEAGRRRIIGRLMRALRTERRRALAGHWSYDLNRHLGLLSAYEGELAVQARVETGLSRNAPAAAKREPEAG
jgi:hypothetical protein